MPAPLLVSAQEKLDCDQIIADYFEYSQQNGASTVGTYDDYVAMKARVDLAVQSTPPQPLFLPLPEGPADEGSKAFKQIADNGTKPIFLAVIKFLTGRLTRDVVMVTTRLFFGQATGAGTSFCTMTDAGNLPHSSGPGVEGVPVDALPEAQYCEIVNPATNGLLVVAAGLHAGERIFGLTRAGGSVSPDSVEIEFRSKLLGDPVTVSSPYTWEGGQPAAVNVRYPYRERLDTIDETAFRRVFG